MYNKRTDYNVNIVKSEKSCVMMSKNSNSVVYSKYDVLLDNGAQASVFYNKDLLTNIRISKNELIFTGLHGKGRRSNIVGEFLGLVKVYVDESASMNILSFSDCIIDGEIIYDRIKDVFLWKTNSNMVITFSKKCNLYVWNFRSGDRSSAVSLNTTVHNNEASYTKRELEGAKLAQDLFRKLCYPDHKRVADMLRNGHHLPIGTKDLMNAWNIYGPSAAMLKGKMKNRQLSLEPANPIPRLIDSKVTLQEDIMFVCNMGFFFSVSIPTHVCMVTKLKDNSRSKASITGAMHSQMDIYRRYGVEVEKVVSDHEGGISAAKEAIPGLLFEPRSSHAHVVERMIDHIKGNTRTLIYSLSYKMPRHMLEYAVMYSVYVSNLMPSAGGLLNVIPRETLTGKKVNHQYVLPAGFGDYVQFKTKSNKSNTMEPEVKEV